MKLFENAKKKNIRFSLSPSAVLLFFLAASGIMWFISIFRHGIYGTQISAFFMRFEDFLADFLNVIGYSAYGDPYNCTAYTGLQEKGYPPLTYVLLRPFSGLVDIAHYYEQNRFLNMYQEPLLLMMLMIAQTAVLCALFFLIYRNAKGSTAKKGLIIGTLMLSRPVFFTIERGNIILLAAVCTACFLFHYQDTNRVRKEIALIALGIAFGLKLSPAVLGFLLLVNKQFREAVRAALYGLFFLFAPFLLLKGGFSNVPLFIRNMKLLVQAYGERGAFLEHRLNEMNLPALAQHAAGITGAFVYLICALLLFFCFFYRRKWERILAITLVLLLAPSFSGYYCVLYLIPAAVMFLTEKRYRPADWLAAVSFLMIFSLYQSEFLSRLDHLSGIYILTFLMLLYGLFAVVQTKLERSAAAAGTDLNSIRSYRIVSGDYRIKIPSVPVAVRRRILIVSGAVLLVSSVGIRLYPVIRDSITYRRGTAQLSKGCYREALDTFTALGRYRDSEEQTAACCKQLTDAAIGAEADGDYEKAADLYRIAPQYADNRIRLADLLELHSDLVQVNDQIHLANMLWIVLEQTENEYLLMSAENVGTHKFYEDPSQEQIDWDNPEAMKIALAQSSHPALTWETSTIRQWLNEEWFPQFPDEVKDRVIRCSIHTPANPTYGTDGGNDTEDNTFLLSAQEFSDYTQKCVFDTKYHAALLRSTGKKEGTVAFFMDNDLYEMGGFNDIVEGEIYPVMRIRR